MSARYFTAADGTRYRVLDSAWRNGKRVVADPPAPWATTRIFNPGGGTHRWCAIREEVNENPTDEQLAAEFALSEPGGRRVALSLGERARRAREAEG